jgi:hypothetical protein
MTEEGTGIYWKVIVRLWNKPSSTEFVSGVLQGAGYLETKEEVMNAKEERRIEFCQNLVCEFDPEAICRFWR